jgi:hypothetical protein
MLACACVNGIVVRRRYGYGADRAGIKEAIGAVVPALAGILGLPDAPACSAHVKAQRVTGHTGNSNAAATSVGANVAPGKALQQLLPDELLRLC